MEILHFWLLDGGEDAIFVYIVYMYFFVSSVKYLFIYVDSPKNAFTTHIIVAGFYSECVLRLQT
jgi:hypothetical protein